MENSKKIRKASIVTADEIIETIYDPAANETQFACYKDGQVTVVGSITDLDEVEIYPLDGRSDLITKRIILFPSAASEYSSTEDLVREIRAYIHKYVDISANFEEIASYYVLLSWLYDRFNEVPYLRALGDFGSGKSRLLQTVGSICYKPIFTGGATTSSPIFRILNDIGGTLVLDEADFKSSEMSDDIVKILNMGYQRGGSVLRTEGKDVREVRAYNVFSPKIVGTRETFSDRALESRFLVEEMGIGTLRKDISRRLPDVFYDEALLLRNKLLMWRFRNYFRPIIFHENLVESISPRLQQIAIPLLSIIESDETKARLITFIQEYAKELLAERGQSRESEVLFAILKLEHDTKSKEVTMKQIADNVNQDSGLDFADQISPKKVGWYLRKKLQLRSHRTKNGWVLSIAKNQKRLDFWKERFGIKDEDFSEHMNDMNDTGVDGIAF